FHGRGAVLLYLAEKAGKLIPLGSRGTNASRPMVLRQLETVQQRIGNGPLVLTNPRRHTMNIDKSDTALVLIDPQNEVLSERGLAWPLVHESVHENRTIENMERLFKAAKAHGFEVFISPHYFYPTDQGWKFNGPLETDEANSGMFARKGVLNLDGLPG